MALPYTESTNMKVWQETGWKIRPLNVPVLIIPPPAAYTDLHSGEPQDLIPIGAFELISPPRRRAIDTLTHRALLERSLRDYGDIWTTLAER